MDTHIYRRIVMSRDIPFYEDSVCDNCGNSGSWDFMGDNLCPQCVAELYGQFGSSDDELPYGINP